MLRRVPTRRLPMPSILEVHSPHGFVFVSVPPDGNCLVSAVLALCGDAAMKMCLSGTACRVGSSLLSLVQAGKVVGIIFYMYTYFGPCGARRLST